jgi:hypothetical protein
MRTAALPSLPKITTAWAIAIVALTLSRFAWADDPACKAVYDSMDRLAGTPNHQWLSQSKSGSHDKPTMGEIITVGDFRYLQMSGEWKRMPYSTAKSITEQADQRKDRSSTCRAVRDESVDGVSANLVAVHTTAEDSASDQQVWISKSTGLPVRQVIDINGTTHIEVRYSYANVAAPTGAK